MQWLRFLARRNLTKHCHSVLYHSTKCCLWGFRPDAVVASADASWWMGQGHGTVETRAGSLVDFLL